MNYYLIDFENVCNNGIKDLTKVQPGSTMIIFYSEKCKNITLDVVDSIVTLDLNYRSFKVNVGKKNALDFQLSSYLGYLIGRSEKDSTYYIVSNDKDFKIVADFWKKQNISVQCISSKELSGSKPAAQNKRADSKNSKKEKKSDAKDLASFDEINRLLNKNDDPAEVFKIFNQYKTKVAINNALARHFKDSKKVSKIYNELKPLLKSKNKS